MPLNEMKIRNAKSLGKFYKLTDSGGLYLHVTEKGGKLWRFKYRFAGKYKLLALGSYPEISLLDARQSRDEARRQLAKGIDPSAARRAQKQATIQEIETFELIAKEWHTRFFSTWSKGYAETLMSRLELYIFPWIGKRPIAEIKAPELLSVLRRIESRGILDTTQRVRIICGQVFRYAVVTGRRELALTLAIEPDAVEMAIDCYQGSFVVQCALKLAPLLFVRPGELRHAEWSEIDFESAEWNIPGSKMKMKEPHLVPLSKQVTEILTELKKLTGSGRYVFPGRTSERPMSDNAILAALRNMGYEKDEMSGHGFRAMARTILDEVLQVRPDFIEHQLAHAVRDPNGRAYNRTAHLAERKKMMQQWADYLDGLKVGAKVLPFRDTK